MTFKHLFILDTFEKLHIDDDTSLYLMEQLMKKGDEVYSCTEYDIALSSKKKICHAYSYNKKIIKDVIAHSNSEPKNDYDLHGFNFIHIRKDPPFDMSYVTLLLLLETVQGPLIINNPTKLLEHNEKMVIFNFQGLITDTYVSSTIQEIKTQIKDLGGKGILKPLFSCRGQGVVLLDETQKDYEEKILTGTAHQKERVMIQRFLPAIINGETRVLMIEDKPLVALKKVPKKGSIYTNLHSGAQLLPHTLTATEKKLCEHIGGFCKKEGLFFTALDIIDDKLSEINMTSPSLLRQADNLYRYNFSLEWIDKLYNKYSML